MDSAQRVKAASCWCHCSLGGSWGHCAEWRKPSRTHQAPHDCLYRVLWGCVSARDCVNAGYSLTGSPSLNWASTLVPIPQGAVWKEGGRSGQTGTAGPPAPSFQGAPLIQWPPLNLAGPGQSPSSVWSPTQTAAARRRGEWLFTSMSPFTCCFVLHLDPECWCWLQTPPCMPHFRCDPCEGPEDSREALGLVLCDAKALILNSEFNCWILST